MTKKNLLQLAETLRCLSWISGRETRSCCAFQRSRRRTSFHFCYQRARGFEVCCRNATGNSVYLQPQKWQGDCQTVDRVPGNPLSVDSLTVHATTSTIPTPPTGMCVLWIGKPNRKLRNAGFIRAALSSRFSNQEHLLYAVLEPSP